LDESRNLRFDISAYNLTNTAQYGYPNVTSVADAGAPGSNFGQITNTINTRVSSSLGRGLRFNVNRSSRFDLTVLAKELVAVGMVSKCLGAARLGDG